MKTQVLQEQESKKRKSNYINLHNTKRIQWNEYRRYAFAI